MVCTDRSFSFFDAMHPEKTVGGRFSRRRYGTVTKRQDIKEETAMNIIAAVDKHWAIGNRGKLLVTIPDDRSFSVRRQREK